MNPVFLCHFGVASLHSDGARIATDMFTLEQHEGRLVELRISAPVERANIALVASQLRDLVQRAPQRVVFVTDLLTIGIFAPDVADAFARIMKSDNPKIERSAFLVGDSAVFGLQIERLIREAGNPARRALRDRNELLQWLDEVLDEREQARLRVFLAA